MPSAKRQHPQSLLALAVLALLFELRMHPYEMAATMRERHKEESIKLRYGSLYTVVETLQRDGLIEPHQTSRDGRRPERTVYTLTDAGKSGTHRLDAGSPALPGEGISAVHGGTVTASRAAAGRSSRPGCMNGCSTSTSPSGPKQGAIDGVLQTGLPPLFLIEAEYEIALQDKRNARSCSGSWRASPRTRRNSRQPGQIFTPANVTQTDGSIHHGRSESCADHRRRSGRPCLAQGLKRAGVNATVYERDRAITDDCKAIACISVRRAAAHARLPAARLFETFTATCGRPPRAFRMLTEHMQTLISVGGFHEPGGDTVEQHRSVSRITLRQVLLSGLGEHVHFGKTFLRYETHGDRVVAFFEDGSRRCPGGGRRGRLSGRGSTCRMRSGSIRSRRHRRQGVPRRVDAPPHPGTASRHAGVGVGTRRARIVRRPQEFSHAAPVNGVGGAEQGVDPAGGRTSTTRVAT